MTQENTSQIAKIIEGPHFLYTGSNGHKTFGITVQNIDSSSIEQRFERAAVAGTLHLLVGRFPVPASNNNRGKEHEHES